MERLSIAGMTKAVAHRVGLGIATRLSDAARGELQAVLAAKGVHVVLSGAETTGRNRNLDLVRILVVDPIVRPLTFATGHGVAFTSAIRERTTEDTLTVRLALGAGLTAAASDKPQLNVVYKQLFRV